jgi:Family of unknown function (DUF6580)
MQPNKSRTDLLIDLGLMAFLIGIDVAARLLPHVPGVWPVAATALFAGRTFRIPVLALVVPLAATALSNLAFANDDWRVGLVVYAAVLVPVFAGMLARRWQGALPLVIGIVSSSLIFFAATNFAVWAFNDMYPMNFQGLVQCYVAALPFLDRTVLGDLTWTAVLFGGAWLVQHRPALLRL